MRSPVESISLKVRDITPVRRFYRDLVGLEVLDERSGRVRLGAGRAIVELNASPEAPERAASEAGLFHLAIRFPDRRALADVLARLRKSGYPLAGASDHDVSEALYMSDPAGNDVELYRDRPESEWQHDSGGRVRMTTRRLDLADLERDASSPTPDRAPDGTDLGHVHLEATDVERAVAFFSDTLGMEVRATRRGAAFLAWDGYHHHVAVNTWRGRRDPHRPASVGVERIALSVPDDVLSRLEQREGVDHTTGDGIDITDPDGVVWRLGTVAAS